MGMPIRVRRGVHKESMRNLRRRPSHNRNYKIHTMKMERKLPRDQGELISSLSSMGHTSFFHFSISYSTFLSFTSISKLYTEKLILSS